MVFNTNNQDLNASSSDFLLTICIATFNRADLLFLTLKNIASQTKNFSDIEILVADGNSTDSTELICAEFSANCKNFTYLKLTEKGGVDKDYDQAVKHSKGKYCWLFTDDDLIKPDAVKKIRELLFKELDLVIINSEICNYDLNRTLKKNALDIQRNLGGTLADFGWDRFFIICGTYITYIGSIAIKKDLWVTKSRSIFYGSRFIHVGVISTIADSTKFAIMSEPLIKIRLGNAEWSNISFKVWTRLWPNLIWTIPKISKETKRKICPKDPSRNLKFLFWLRALGHYSVNEFNAYMSQEPFSVNKILVRIIALIPQNFPRVIYQIYAMVKNDRVMSYQISEGRITRNLWHSTE